MCLNPQIKDERAVIQQTATAYSIKKETKMNRERTRHTAVTEAADAADYTRQDELGDKLSQRRNTEDHAKCEADHDHGEDYPHARSTKNEMPARPVPKRLAWRGNGDIPAVERAENGRDRHDANIVSSSTIADEIDEGEQGNGADDSARNSQDCLHWVWSISSVWVE